MAAETAGEDSDDEARAEDESDADEEDGHLRRALRNATAAATESAEGIFRGFSCQQDAQERDSRGVFL